VKLVVAPFDAPGCLGRVGSRPSNPATAIAAPRTDTNLGFRIFDAKRYVGVFLADIVISPHYLRSVERTGHPAGGRSEIGTLADVTLTAVLGINPWAQAPSAGPWDLPVHAPALLLPRQEQILQKIVAFS
jgi:hypothetical protein